MSFTCTFTAHIIVVFTFCTGLEFRFKYFFSHFLWPFFEIGFVRLRWFPLIPSCLEVSTYQISWAVSGRAERIRVRRMLLRISLDTGVSCGDRKFLLQKWLQCWSPAYIMLSKTKLRICSKLIGWIWSDFYCLHFHFCCAGKYVFVSQH